MILQFQTKNITFFEEDEAYFQKRFLDLEKFLGSEIGDENSVETRITIKKSKQHSGKRFEAAATIFAPHHGKFHAQTESENIKKCADELKDKLKEEIKKIHEKKERRI